MTSDTFDTALMWLVIFLTVAIVAAFAAFGIWGFGWLEKRRADPETGEGPPTPPEG
jgi:hypothetical protein